MSLPCPVCGVRFDRRGLHSHISAAHLRRHPTTVAKLKRKQQKAKSA